MDIIKLKLLVMVITLLVNRRKQMKELFSDHMYTYIQINKNKYIIIFWVDDFCKKMFFLLHKAFSSDIIFMS